MIRDYGKGMKPPEEQEIKSIGLLMIDQLAKQLKGTTHRQIDNGISFELTFPATSW